MNIKAVYTLFKRSRIPKRVLMFILNGKFIFSLCYFYLMPVQAYIFFKVELGKTQHVIDALRDIPQIITAAVVTGGWDIVARIEVKDLEELFDITSTKIHLIEGITETQTAVIEKEIVQE